MIEIKPNEGLCEYIRRHDEMVKEMKNISGIPANLTGKHEKFGHSVTGITITGGIEFIEKFIKALSNNENN